MKGSMIPGAPPADLGLSGSSMASVPFGEGDDVNPMANITNMVDAMLVLAVGLMMALVTAMNVNLYDMRELLDEDLQQIEQPEEILDEVYNTENPYIEMGKVYQDPTTGKTYVLTEEGEDKEAEAGLEQQQLSAEGDTSEEM